jgi:hypothetical protein
MLKSVDNFAVKCFGCSIMKFVQTFWLQKQPVNSTYHVLSLIQVALRVQSKEITEFRKVT